MKTTIVLCIFCQVTLTITVIEGKMYLLYFILLFDQPVKTMADQIQAVKAEEALTTSEGFFVKKTCPTISLTWISLLRQRSQIMMDFSNRKICPSIPPT
jgi:hypothetical protein